MSRFLLLLASLLLAPVPALADKGLLHHDLEVKLQPGQKSLTATDNITLPRAVDRLTLDLHVGLEPVFSP